VTAAVGTGDTVCGAIKSVAMTLRLTAAETEALRRKVAAQQRSMQHVARDEICSYISSPSGSPRSPLRSSRKTKAS
jgi:hypothetical protein